MIHPSDNAKHSLTARIVCWAMLVASVGAGPATMPADKIWDLGFAKGTAAEVGAKVNVEALRLSRRRQELVNQIAEEKAVNDRVRRARLDAVHSTPAYKAKAANLAGVELALDASRKAHSGQSIALSSELNHDKADLSLMEFTALNRDDALKRSSKIIEEYSDDLRKTEPALKAANEWRDAVISGVEGSLQLKWPLQTGEEGLLGEIANVEARPQGAMFRSHAIEWLEQISEQEKIGTYHVIGHPFLGVMRDGTPDLRIAVRVDRISRDEGIVVQLRSLPDHEISILMRALHGADDLNKN